MTSILQLTLRDEPRQIMKERLAVISALEAQKIVRELMPDHDGYGGSLWSWEILMPELMPDIPWLQANVQANNGIIRL